MDRDDNNDDNYFLADDFDDLPANTLQDLEYRAILSTQHVNPIVASGRQPHEQNARRNTVRENRQPPVRHESTITGSIEGPDGSDYGFDDEDVINLDEPSAIYDTGLQPPKDRDRSAAQSRQAPIPQNIRTIGQPHQLPHRANENPFSPHLSNGHANATESRDEIRADIQKAKEASDLQKRVEELERERTALLKTVEDAKSSALSKAGEIAIVRSNHDKASKEYERRLAVIQKLHAEEIEKQKRELEIARKDRERVETTNKFLQHDLAQETDRTRQSRRTLQDRPTNVRYQSGDGRQSPAKTPKRGKIAPFRDGFDDDEVMVVSPSKSKPRSKPNTPKAGGKRKRHVENSPMQPLEIDGPPEQPAEPHQSNKAPSTAVTLDLPLRPAAGDSQFKFLQRVINHRPSEGQARTFEALAQYRFLSKPERSLSSQLNDGLTFQAYGSTAGSFCVEFCRTLVSLWQQCLDEQLYAPIYLFIDLLQFVLSIEPLSVAAKLIENIVPVVIATVDLVAIPIAKASLDPSFTLPESHVRLTKEIDVSACLKVLNTVAENSSLSPEIMAIFWEQMEFDFVLLMLHKVQPLPQVMLMLQLLATSPLEMTFGAICAEATTTGQQQQQEHEIALLDRLTSLLIDTPQKQDEEPHSKTEILDLRLAVVDVLLALSLTRHGTESLTSHRYAVGRLVRFLQDAINNLYFLSPALNLPSSPSIAAPQEQNPSQTPHQQTTQSINLTTRLLHHLLISSEFNPVQVNIREKLVVIHGGSHKFYVALSRLAFSEQVVLEAGIEDATVDAAHSILDSMLSPEEGEAFGKVFESPKRSV